MKKCKNCGKELNCKQQKCCSNRCKHIYFKVYKISAFYNSKIQNENRQKAAITNKKRGTGIFDFKTQSKGGKSRAILMKRTGSGFYDPKIQSMGGKAGWKKCHETNKKNKTGFWGSKASSNSVKQQRKNKTGFFNSDTQRQTSLMGWKKKTKEERELWISNILKGLQKRPTSFEKKISELCIENSLPFIYTGDGRFLINFKNPDFVNKKDKIVIEVFYSWFKIRDYGSVEKYTEFCKKKYNPMGWSVIFIDENEVNVENWEELCLNKIQEAIK